MAKDDAPKPSNSVWSINLQGARVAVVRDVKKAKTIPENADQRQLDSVKQYIESEVSELIPKFTGVKVIASGELNTETGRNVASIEIYGLDNLSL